MIIVTGAAGFIGSVMLAKLNAEGVDDILAVDILGSDARWKNLSNKRISDFLHRDELVATLERGAISKVDAIIHLGACSSTQERDVDYLIRNNFAYSKSLASYCIANRVRFIYASSAATYGDGAQGFSDEISALDSLRPMNPYGFSKQLFDLWMMRHGYLEKGCGIKFFNVFGPNEAHKTGMHSGVFNAYRQILADGCVRLFKSYDSRYPDGGQKRDFVYVRDCVDVMWWLLHNPEVNGIFNLGSGHASTWLELVVPVFEAMGKKPNIEFIEMPAELQAQYQYFTEAPMARLRGAGYDRPFTPLDHAVKDYVGNFLLKSAIL